MSTNSQNGIAPIVIILVVVALLGLAGAGFLLTKNQSLQNRLESLGKEKAKIETELAVLENSNLAKENENLQFQLGIAKKDLAISQKELTDQKAKIGSLDEKLTKIRPYVEAIDVIQKVFFTNFALPSTSEITSRVDPKIKVLDNPELLENWLGAKALMNSPQGSWSGGPIGVVVTGLINRILDLLP